jgi:hypothetical protein
VYTTVYELDSWAVWRSYVLAPVGAAVLIPVALAAGCVLLAVIRRRPLYFVGTVPFLLVLTFWVPVLLGESQWGRSLLGLYAGGGCQVVEGTTHVRALQRLEGHSIDRIEIGGIPFEVSHFELGPQYRDSIAYGGVLKEGVDARVWYCPPMAFSSGTSGPIVRVDVKNRSDSPPAR